MRILLVPDKFRGTATAQQVIDAMAAVLRSDGHRVSSLLLSDGGEGFLDGFGGPNRTTTVTDPLGDEVEAGWRLSRGVAVIEMARSSGLSLVGGAEGNDALAASTYGTGELIARALESGAKRIIVGIGGSASTDGGLGALRALEPVHRLLGVQLDVGCDVQTLFLDAAERFAAQKGASPAAIRMLDVRLGTLAQMYESDYGVDVRDIVGSGAGGGLAGGLAAIGGELHSGFDLVAEHVGLEQAIEESDLVITGEGFLDDESFNGKLVGGVAEMCGSSGVPVVAVVGQTFDDVEERLQVVSLLDRFGQDRALGDTLACLADAARMAVEMAVSDGA